MEDKTTFNLNPHRTYCGEKEHPTCKLGIGKNGGFVETGYKVVARSTKTLDSGEEAKVVSSYEKNKTFLDFYIPRGLSGESEIISAGVVETVEPDKNAEVLDRFEGGVHFLDFWIPRGKMGNAGVGEKIEVDCVVTVDYDEPARVEDDFSDNTHRLSFYIPRGTPYRNNKSIAQLIKNSAQTVTAVDTVVEFDELNEIASAKLTSTEAQVLVAGTYKVDISTSVKVANDVRFTLYINDTPVRDSNLLLSNDVSFLTKTLLLNLQVEDKLSLRVTAMTNQFSFENGTSFASLTITPLEI